MRGNRRRHHERSYQCTRKNTCYDCDDEKCWGHGDKGADCPKYHCDNPNGVDDCEHCSFIDEFIEGLRKEYLRNMRDLKLYEAVNYILNFITVCGGDMHTLITPDGEKIGVDCDNLLEDLGNIGKYAMGTDGNEVNHFAEVGKMV